MKTPPALATAPVADADGGRSDNRLVAIIADVRGWAFDNIANNLQIILKDRARIAILHDAEMSSHALFGAIFTDRTYDHVHFLSRETYLRFFFDDAFTDGIIAALAKDLHCDRSGATDRLADGMGRTTLTFGVYDHIHLEEACVRDRRAALAVADGYAVSSEKLSRLYTSAYGIAPTVETPDGVDRRLFRPNNPDRFSQPGRPLVVGWVGNSEWHSEAGTDPKGLETIVRPAIDRLVGEGLAVVADFADRKQFWRQRHEMPGYYHGIDVLLCASTMEGTPNPVLEAMACGVPVIATDVGIVAEVLGRKQREFIISRDVSQLADAIRRLYLDRGLLTELSQENLQQIEHRTWADFTANWCHLLEAAQHERVRGRGVVRTSLVLARCANLDLTIENAAMRERQSGWVAAVQALRTTLVSTSQTQDARLRSIEVSQRTIIEDILARQQDKLRSIEMSLQTILQVALWQRKMLRPVHWVWVRVMPIRRLIARVRRRR